MKKNKLGKPVKKYTFNYSIFSNKKAAIGLDSIGSWINGIVSILPPAVKFLLFIFILATLSYVLSLVFNAFGVYCNSAELPVKLNSNLLTSISLITEIPNPENLGKEAQEIDGILSDFGLSDCTQFEPEGQIVYKSNGQKYNLTTGKDFYFATQCVKCEVVNICGSSIPGFIGSNLFGGLGCHKRCEANANRKPDEERSLLDKTVCGKIACDPPPHYYYDNALKLYVCQDATCKGITLGQIWDEKLASKGATLFYKDSIEVRNPSGEHVLGLTCSELKPRLAIYGIDLFTYSMWLIIMIITILIWGLNEIRK